MSRCSASAPASADPSGVSSSGQFECPNALPRGVFGKYAHPQDCALFYVCIAGVPREYREGRELKSWRKEKGKRLKLTPVQLNWVAFLSW